MESKLGSGIEHPCPFPVLVTGQPVCTPRTFLISWSIPAKDLFALWRLYYPLSNATKSEASYRRWFPLRSARSRFRFRFFTYRGSPTVQEYRRNLSGPIPTIPPYFPFRLPSFFLSRSPSPEEKLKPGEWKFMHCSFFFGACYSVQSADSKADSEARKSRFAAVFARGACHASRLKFIGAKSIGHAVARDYTSDREFLIGPPIRRR